MRVRTAPQQRVKETDERQQRSESDDESAARLDRGDEMLDDVLQHRSVMPSAVPAITAPFPATAVGQDFGVNDWFLPSARRVTAGNAVRPLVHGANYFARLVEVVEQTTAGDQIFFTDWRGDPDQLLGDTGPTVSQLFASAARRGVEVRALIWRSHSDRTSFSAQENADLGRDLNEAGGCALLDERVRRGGSHHQKVVVVRHRDRSGHDVAFVGGIDLSHSRRDDAAHEGDRQRQPMDRRYGDRPPWHDVMLEVRGPAVEDVHASFVERWNDPTPLDRRNPYRRWRQRQADMPEQAPPLPPPPPAPVAGAHEVQVLRTYARKRPAYPFAVTGERTIARAYEHAFRRARHLIYIEDQYLWSAVVAGTLADALRRAPTLHVIAVVPRFPDADGRFSGPPNRLGQLEAMKTLAAAGGDRFAAYDLESPSGAPVYVHAKVCIVDDAWMTCGSDNFNRRSWTHDSELTCAVVDPEGALPSALRRLLWSEHLGLPESHPGLADLEHAHALWRSRVGKPGCRATPHEPAPVGRLQRPWALPLQRLVFDPDGRRIADRVRRTF
jgi:phosphatidylserine/phosphatidylglycerophosphate/cardiolipin synthase-like enzyme